MYVDDSESYDSAETGEKVTAVPGLCHRSSTAHHCSFLIHFKIIIAYIYICT